MTTRGFVRIEGGEVHYAEAGSGEPVLLLHQTPRSWDEFRDVLPLLAQRGYRAIAMDTLGFGDSSKPGPDTIEGYARGAAAFLEALGVERAAVVGHHTGGVIAVELAATRPELVGALVLSGTPLVDEAFLRERERNPAPDTVAPRFDGRHVLALWRGRQSFYPDGRTDLLERFLVDALKAGDASSGGHDAVRAYDMRPKLAAIRAPVLLINATEDRFATPFVEPLREALPGSRVVDIEGGMVPLPDQLPEQYAAAVADFLSSIEQPSR